MFSLVSLKHFPASFYVNSVVVVVVGVVIVDVFFLLLLLASYLVISLFHFI